MAKIVLTTTPSFSNTIVRSPDLAEFLDEHSWRVVLDERLNPPFSFNPEEVAAMVAGALLPVGKKEFSLFPNLKVVMPFGVGLEHIDIPALEERGIALKFFPGINKHSVAELTMAFIFTLARNIVPFANDMREGKWKRTSATQVSGKTLGIVGLGNIGKEVAKMARNLGMRVLANDIVYDEDFLKSIGVEKSELETLLQKSDFITFHVPLTDLTKQIVNEKLLSLLKPGAYVINTSRGEVTDEKALLAAVESGWVAGVALDVFSEEPPFNNEILKRLISHPKVIAMPHIATFTPETQYAVAKKICEELVNHGK
ncbi:MAG: 3-phosphoglycerate dehydrogenase [Candidatus Harrisonbacteria bacterium]|nr:3-phosphoglycerate dehydrogenase [Candidatus Harrisonbacteria bacterium]